jgi:hypothetical protein
MKKAFLGLAATFCLVFLVVPSQAAIKASATNTSAVSFSDNLAHLIPLLSNGTTAIRFSTGAANQKVIVTFNAECSVAGTDNMTWLDIDIMVDGVIIPPSNNDNAFCTDHGTGSLSNWVSATVVGVYTVPSAGQHIVEVRGGLHVFDSGDAWRIDDSSTTVVK